MKFTEGITSINTSFLWHHKARGRGESVDEDINREEDRKCLQQLPSVGVLKTITFGSHTLKTPPYLNIQNMLELQQNCCKYCKYDIGNVSQVGG